MTAEQKAVVQVRVIGVGAGLFFTPLEQFERVLVPVSDAHEARGEKSVEDGAEKNCGGHGVERLRECATQKFSADASDVGVAVAVHRPRELRFRSGGIRCIPARRIQKRGGTKQQREQQAAEKFCHTASDTRTVRMRRPAVFSVPSGAGTESATPCARGSRDRAAPTSFRDRPCRTPAAPARPRSSSPRPGNLAPVRDR